MARILVVDDDEQIRQMLVQTLQQAGYEVADVTNGTEAIAAAGLVPFDLMITDILMPETDGLEVISQLRAKCPKMRIIAISGGGLSEIDLLPTAKLLGAVRTLYKPFELKRLLAVVTEVLEMED